MKVGTLKEIGAEVGDMVTYKPPNHRAPKNFVVVKIENENYYTNDNCKLFSSNPCWRYWSIHQKANPVTNKNVKNGEWSLWHVSKVDGSISNALMKRKNKYEVETQQLGKTKQLAYRFRLIKTDDMPQVEQKPVWPQVGDRSVYRLSPSDKPKYATLVKSGDNEKRHKGETYWQFDDSAFSWNPANTPQHTPIETTENTQTIETVMWKDKSAEDKVKILTAIVSNEAVEKWTGSSWIHTNENPKDNVFYRLKPVVTEVTLYSGCPDGEWGPWIDGDDTHKITFILIDGEPDPKSITIAKLS